MDTSTSQLFLETFSTLVKNYNESYGRATDGQLKPIVPSIEDIGHGFNIWDKDETAISSRLLELLISSSQHMCGINYYIGYNTAKHRIQIHVF